MTGLNRVKFTQEEINFVRKVDEKEALYISLLNNLGVSAKYIARKFGYKYFDVYNVLRGNSFNYVTGRLDKKATSEQITVVKYLLKQGHPYREIARYAGIEDNVVRSIKGFLMYNNEI